jgi:flagellar operon protein
MSAIEPAASQSVDIADRIAAGTATSLPTTAPAQAEDAAGAANFAQTLRAASVGITLSGHAATRLSSRQIDLSEGDLSKLSDAMNRAAAKGARSSLVVIGRQSAGPVGLVVSIPNRTVITAVDTQAMKDNIFTNIDSAMVI